VGISFDEAITVAVLGLAVNFISAVILKERDQGHDRDHPHHHDHNLKAAYLHVLADTLTSLLAISALVMGRFFGWAVLDPLMGLVGAAVITRWSYGLLRDTGRVLLDMNAHSDLERDIRKVLEGDGCTCIEDLHIWQLGPGHFGAVISVRSDATTPEGLKGRLCDIGGLSHVTIEVN
jgi:cation diffusion facilitator family transporter